MDLLECDPDISAEFVQVLYNKLRQRREELTQLRALPSREAVLVDSTTLQAENERLKAKLSELQLQATSTKGISSITNNEVSDSGKSGAVVSHAIMEQRRSAEKETMSELEARLASYKVKNREMKSDVTQLANILDPMIERLEEKTLHLANDRKRLIELELEVEATKTKTLNSSLNLDLRSFIAGKNKPKDHKFPNLGNLKPFVSSARFSGLPVAMQHKYHALELLVLSPEDSIVPKTGIDRIVHFLPAQTYDPTAHNGNGGWAETSLARTAQEGGQGQQWEVIFRRNDQWFYYGTYACVGFSTTTDTEAFSCNSKISQPKLKGKTVVHGDQVPPVVSNFIATLYEGGKTGPTSFLGIGLERVAFNQGFYQSLLSHKKKLQQVGSSSGGAKKRAKGASAKGGRSQKKRKSN